MSFIYIAIIAWIYPKYAIFFYFAKINAFNSTIYYIKLSVERGLTLTLDAIIRIRNLRKVYRVGNEKVIALDNINLDIAKGEVCCILGTSGSGKSTLLNQLAGLEKPTSGCVYIGKNNISKFSENRLAGFRQKNIGFIFQSYNLLTALTAVENVSMPLMFRGVPKNKREKMAAFMLKQVGLGSRLSHRPSQMSGGQQQRVGIARAFVAKPKIVFADEPTGNLDTKTTIEVMELMVRMSRENNQTFILVTHDGELADYADRIVTLIDGKIVSDVHNISKIDRQKALENKLKTYEDDEMQTNEIIGENGESSAIDETSDNETLPINENGENSPIVTENDAQDENINTNVSVVNEDEKNINNQAINVASVQTASADNAEVSDDINKNTITDKEINPNEQ